MSAAGRDTRPSPLAEHVPGGGTCSTGRGRSSPSSTPIHPVGEPPGHRRRRHDGKVLPAAFGPGPRPDLPFFDGSAAAQRRVRHRQSAGRLRGLAAAMGRRLMDGRRRRFRHRSPPAGRHACRQPAPRAGPAYSPGSPHVRGRSDQPDQRPLSASPVFPSRQSWQTGSPAWAINVLRHSD